MPCTVLVDSWEQCEDPDVLLESPSVMAGIHIAEVLCEFSHSPSVMRPVLFNFFLDYWQVTLIWSPYGDASLICSLLIGDMSTIYYTDVAARVTMTLY